MPRPFGMPKADSAFSRSNAVFDTPIGWRFVKPHMKALYGVDSMPETALHVAQRFGIDRVAQDAMALRSQLDAVRAQLAGFFDAEFTPVSLLQKQGEPLPFQPRRTPARCCSPARPPPRGMA